MFDGPTVAFGSGGAESSTNVPDGPLKPSPTPSKPAPSAGAAAGPTLDCTTGSAPPGAGTGGPFLGSLSFFAPAGAAAGAIVRSGGEVSCLTFCAGSSTCFADRRPEPDA